MARDIRIQSTGGQYRGVSRGDRREAIFHDDDDRLFFFSTR